jgi:hypothetical protein
MLAVGGVVTPLQAHCVKVEDNPDAVHSGDHPHCTNDAGPAGGGEYLVEVKGDFSTGGTKYFGRDGNPKTESIDVNFQFLNLDLSFLKSMPGGVNCFSDGPEAGFLTALSIVQDKDKPLAAWYFFTAKDNDGATKVSYLLKLSSGESFDPGWRPLEGEKGVEANFDQWKISVEGSGKKIACTGSGDMNTSIWIQENN